MSEHEIRSRDCIPGVRQLYANIIERLYLLLYPFSPGLLLSISRSSCIDPAALDASNVETKVRNEAGLGGARVILRKEYARTVLWGPLRVPRNAVNTRGQAAEPRAANYRSRAFVA